MMCRNEMWLSMKDVCISAGEGVRVCDFCLSVGMSASLKFVRVKDVYVCACVV